MIHGKNVYEVVSSVILPFGFKVLKAGTTSQPILSQVGLPETKKV